MTFILFRNIPFICKNIRGNYNLKTTVNTVRFLQQNLLNSYNIDICQLANYSNNATCSRNLPIVDQMKEVLQLKGTKISNWIVERHIKSLCTTYVCLDEIDRKKFLIALAAQYSINKEEICGIVTNITENNSSDVFAFKNSERLKNLLLPPYQWIFLNIGRLENGVKFLVDLRTDILRILIKMKSDDPLWVKMQQLNMNLRELLSIWFSVGFLKLQRLTWKSSCEMLQKVAEYEKIHPIRSWADLKRRVGPYRRCFIYTHHSMPNEPLVILHTALTNEITQIAATITKHTNKKLPTSDMDIEKSIPEIVEDVNKINTAIFYSIASTQNGLAGIELGNYLIKRVANELVTEFPSIKAFSSLSPIPNFRKWLVGKLKDNTVHEVFSNEEITLLENLLENKLIATELKKRLNNNGWLEMPQLVVCLENPFMKMCAQYLYKEKRRSYALNNVANFHLRNGAVMWRLNWLSDPSHRGLENSFGIMVNYRYYLNETENNSRNYIEKHLINASEHIKKFVAEK